MVVCCTDQILSSDDNEDFFTIPGLAGGAIGTKYDFNTTYAPNPELQNRSVSIPQGKVVGGSTKLNRMVFDRGSISDFDRWAELGNSGWGYADLLPYFKKVRGSYAQGPFLQIVSSWTDFGKILTARDLYATNRRHRLGVWCRV